MTTSKHLADLRALESENARLRADLSPQGAAAVRLAELAKWRAEVDKRDREFPGWDATAETLLDCRLDVFEALHGQADQ